MILDFLNINEMFDPDSVITDHQILDPKTKKFTKNGVFSEEVFGSITSDTTIYQCSCGKYKGVFYKNKECEDCNTKVISSKPSVSKLGWIDLDDDYPLINPVFYNFIERLFRPKNLNGILDYNNRLNKKGELIDLNDSEKTSPYHGIGLVELYRNFDEILEYFYSKSNVQNKDAYYNLIKSNRDKLFISKIPIISPVLRPALVQGREVGYDKINTHYSIIIRISNTIKNSEPKEMVIYPLVGKMQQELMNIMDMLIQNISGKTGFIRNNIMGSRINFSARNVIIPLSAGHEIDEAHVPYLTFLELYRFHILNILSRTKQLSLSDASYQWHRARTRFDPEIYRIMEEIIEKSGGGAEFLLNRNPTINVGSILQLRFTKVKRDINDLTLSIHNTILAPMGGDYDGDTLNIIPLMDNESKRTFSTLNPKRLLISPNDGKFNDQLNIERDQVLGIYSLCNN